MMPVTVSYSTLNGDPALRLAIEKVLVPHIRQHLTQQETSQHKPQSQENSTPENGSAMELAR